jgi:hypothetical protein
LEALLSPAAEQRQPAEDYLKAMTGTDRCGAFLQALSTIQQPHLQQMIAVLLRRAILRMQPQHISILPDMVDLLLAAFGNSDSSRRTSVGDCLAEVCAVLSVLAPPSECAPVMQKILQAIGTSVRVYIHTCDMHVCTIVLIFLSVVVFSYISHFASLIYIVHTSILYGPRKPIYPLTTIVESGGPPRPFCGSPCSLFPNS